MRGALPRHGHTVGLVSKTYTCWLNMKSRCNYKKSKSFERYGARGIKVCKRWQKFENFLADMGQVPKNKSLDRINNNGNYSKSNCRWATNKEQANNKRTYKRRLGNGVYKENQKYLGALKFKGKSYRIGLFKNKHLAQLAVDAAKLVLIGGGLN